MPTIDVPAFPGAVTRVGGRKLFAHRLTSVRRPDEADIRDVPRDLVAILTALEGHRDCTFTVQWLCSPRVGDPRGGLISVCVITALDVQAEVERLVEVADDVADLLSGPPGLWRFEPVVDPDELAQILRPVEPRHVAEIARREEELPQTPTSSALGFAGGEVRSNQGVPGLWALWTLGPPAEDTDRLAASLLAQEVQVCLRMTLEPTALDGQERDTLEDLVHGTAPVSKETSSYRAAHQTLESLLYLRPLFRTRCVVASEEPLSPSLLSTIGHTLSEPAKHVEPPPPALAGGYAVIRVPPEEAEAAFALPDHGRELPSFAPSSLAGLRRLFGVWEAANLFRLPVLGEHDAQGLAVDEAPLLPGILSHLPSEGTRIGSLPLHTDRPVSITATDRFRHTYVVGQTGTGKSTLLQNMALDDIRAGHGVCVIDPHGDLVEGILARLPEDRLDDVILIDPGDPQAVVGVNLIEAESEVQQNYLVAELSNMFYALFDPGRVGIVGPRFETMLRQAVLLLQAGDVPASFLDVPTIFTDRAVRDHLTKLVRDPILAEYWRGEVVQNRSNEWGEVVSWFRSKFEVFRTSSLLRRVVGQAHSTFTFADALSSQKVVLINLSKGAIGEYNSSLLGHVIVMKMWGSILERALVPHADRREFFIYIDEFQNFTTDSLDTMLAEARKYGIGLTLANQFFEQLSTKTRAALLGNVGSKLAFRLGPSDARSFTSWVGGDLEADELVHLPNHQLVAALSPVGMPTAPVLLHTYPPSTPDLERAEQGRAGSRLRYGRPVTEVDEAFVQRWKVVPGSIAASLDTETAEREAAQLRESRHQSFLDDLLKSRRRKRRWTWIDDWLDQQLQASGLEQIVVVRGTVSDPREVDWEAIAERVGLEGDFLADNVTEGRYLGLTWPLAGRFVLEMRARGLGAELFINKAIADTRVPDDVALEVLGFPQPVMRELLLHGLYTVGDARAASDEVFYDLDVPERLRRDVEALRGDCDPSPWMTGLDNEEGPGNLSAMWSSGALESLAEALAAKVAALPVDSHYVVNREDGLPDDSNDLPADGRSDAEERSWYDDVARRQYRAELTFEVVQRLPDIIQLVGELDP